MPRPTLALASLLLLAASLAACSSSHHASDTPRASTTHASPQAAAQTLIKLDDAWSAAAATRDAAKVASFYTADAVAYPPNEPVAVGRAAAQKVWATYLADPSFTISWKSSDASVSGDMGYTAGAYTASYNGPDGNKVTEIGKFLCVWKQQPDGTWKAIRDMWNTDAR